MVEAANRSGHPVDDLPEAGTNVLFDVWLVSRSTTQLLDEALSSTGLTGDEFGIYSVLTSAEALTPSELARWMSAPPTTVSSYVKRLEERNHVVREPNPDDRRSYRIRLTPEGRQKHQAGVQAFIPVLDHVVAALGRNETAVRTALGALRAALDSLRDPVR
jgi:DNA-binding MarR family transcriptional regulator